MSWKTANRSFYYEGAPEPEDLSLPAAETALLCIDVQNYGLEPKATEAENERWAPFFQRMRDTVIPNLRSLQTGREGQCCDRSTKAGPDATEPVSLQRSS